MLDAPRYPEFLLDALVLACLLLDLLHERSGAVRTPLFDDLASGDAVDNNDRGNPLLAGWRHTLELPSIVDGAHCESTYHQVAVC
jgi:hypothetical protein